MFGLSFVKILPIVLKALPVILIGLFVAYLFVQNGNLKSTVAVLEINNEKLTESISKQQDVIDQQTRDIGNVIEANLKLQRVRDQQAEGINELRDKFNKVNDVGKRRDIGELATNSSNSVRRIINIASKNALRCLEISMGAKLTNAETSATKKSEINTLCFDIANPNFTSFN